MANPKATLFPESLATGFTSIDGTVQFYTQVQALVQPHHVVLDLGAGRGQGFLDDSVPYRRELRSLRGKCQELIGCDVDDVVLTNPGVDRAFLIGDDGALDLPDASVDLIYADYVLEHIPDPAKFSEEVKRVLKPGGWFCARTPNKYGYVATASRLVPNRLHAKVVSKVQHGRKEEDVFPTLYRMNTQKDLKLFFPISDWLHCTFGWEPEPGYCGSSMLAWQAVMIGTRLLPRALASVLMVFIQKRCKDAL